MKNMTLKRFFLTIIICLSVNYVSKGQELSDDSLRKMLEINPQNFYKQLNQLRDLESVYMRSKQLKDSYIQTLGMLNSACGNYEETYKLWSQRESNNEQPVDSVAFDKYRPVSAKKIMDSIAKTNQIVILNEGHHIPQNRASTMQYLQIFYDNGFRYIAMESIRSRDSLLNQRKYVDVNKSGTYLFEPCYADLVRQALKIGFTIVPYEYEPKAKTMVEREEGQAENIMKRLLNDNPKAKLLMHVGYSHGLKFEPDPQMKMAMMGYFLKKKSGTEPFVIEQFKQTEKAYRKDESTDYVYATKKYQLTEPCFFVNNEGKLWTKDSYAGDAELFLPRSIYKNQRPNWLAWGGKKREFLPNLKEVKVETPFLIQAFLVEESLNGVAVDQIEITDKISKKPLLLYPAKYILRVLDRKGEVISEKKIVVK